MTKVSGLISHKMGTALVAITADAEATNVKSETITSSPNPIPKANNAASIAIVPFATAMQCFAS